LGWEAARLQALEQVGAAAAHRLLFAVAAHADDLPAA
jgi:hypothetical protein